MRIIVDLTGRRFERLKVLERLPKQPGEVVKYLCLCDCGNKKIVSSGNLQNLSTKSCGCYNLEAIKKANTKHGYFGTPTYVSWASMKTRCTNPKSPDYPRYGGRGIKVCDRWLHSFENFLLDLGERPHLKFTLERKQNNKGYEPGNCYWASPKEQANNRSSNVTFLFNNEILNIAQIAEVAGIRRDMLSRLLRKGYSLEEAVARLKLSKKRNMKPKNKDNPRAVEEHGMQIWGMETPEGTIHAVDHTTGDVWETQVVPLTDFSELMVPVFDPTNVSLVIRG